jgi:hypothetical protein
MNKMLFSKIEDVSFNWDSSCQKPLNLTVKNRGSIIFGITEIPLTEKEAKKLYKFLCKIFKKEK